MSQYTTGTVTVTNGSPTVTGSGTSWSGNVTVGSVFTKSASGVPYIVGSVDSNTQITLTSNYAGTTQSGQSYSITTSFTPNRKLPYMEQGDVDPATVHKRAMVALDTLLGSAYTAKSMLYSDASGNVASTAAPTNGQLLVGSTGNVPALATLTGTSNQITVTNGAGSITLSTPQNIGTGSSPSFAGLTLTGALSGTTAAFSSTVDGFVTSQFVNPSTGTSAVSRVMIGNNVSAGAFQLVVYGGNHGSLPNVVDINQANGAALRILQSNTHRAGWDTSGHFLPATDNTYNIGSGSFGWKEIFCDNGTINTSDATRKTPVRPLNTAEIAAAQDLVREIGIFQFLAAMDEKGADAARLHVGMTVQRAIELMQSHGLDPYRYSFICRDEWAAEIIEHPEVEARPAADALPAEYVTRISEETAIVDGKETVIKRENLVCIKEAVPAQPAVESSKAWTEVVREAGARFGFRREELLLFMLRGLAAKLDN